MYFSSSWRIRKIMTKEFIKKTTKKWLDLEKVTSSVYWTVFSTWGGVYVLWQMETGQIYVNN